MSKMQYGAIYFPIVPYSFLLLPTIHICYWQYEDYYGKINKKKKGVDYLIAFTTAENVYIRKGEKMGNQTALFQLRNVSKVFRSKDLEVRAVDDISLDIFAGEIFGIIGMSGAGKSTLVRTLNRLEDVTSGQIIFDGQVLGGLSSKELRSARRSMAMIFQNFNLLMQKTVLDNVMLPMKIAHVPHKEQKERALQMLKVVGLENKAPAWPAQLSGGQR